MNDIVGYLVWEWHLTGPEAVKYDRQKYDNPQPETAKGYKDRLIHKQPLNGALYDLPLADLRRYFPLPPPPPVVLPEPVVTRVSMWTKLQKVKLDKVNGHLIQIEGLAESFNIGVVNLGPEWKAGARVYWSLEIKPDNPKEPVGVTNLKPAPSAPAGILVVNDKPVTTIKAIAD